MKKLFKIVILTIAVAGFFTSCSEDDATGGEGKVNLSLYINDNVNHLSRATTQEQLADSAIIYIYSSKGLVRKYRGVNELPAELWLVSGSYTATASAGDSVPASFTSKYYKGSTGFEITKATPASAKIDCKIANVVASVKWDASVAPVLKDYKLTIGHGGGTLDFTAANTDAKGYFMMPDGETALTWTLTGTQLDGTTYTQKGTIPDVKPTTEYDMTISYNGTTGEFGGALFNIKVDETAIEFNDNFQLTAAPKITGSGFDITQAVYGEKGTLKKMSVYATAAAALTQLKLSGDVFTKLGLGSNTFDFLSMTDAAKTEVTNLGITNTYTYDATNDESISKITFALTFLNQLDNGSYPITITAVDAKGKTRTQVLDIEISDASVFTTAIDVKDVYATKATIYGSIAKTGITNPGVEYRAVGAADWISVAGTVSGTTFSAALTGLTPATTYQFRAKCDGYTANDVQAFTTETETQLPNAGFENWSTGSDGASVLYESGGSMFWDSGNHGSITLSKNVTTSDGTVKHSGNYSVKLASQFVGVGFIGKFAAGNVFVGKYLATDGTDGVLGFGRAFTSRPTSLTGYVRYTPGSVDYTSLSSVASGSTDKGVVYVALLDATTMSYNSETWPQIIKTKSSARQLFDSSTNNSAIIAYGEMILTSATTPDAGESMTKFTIDLKYRDTRKPSYILIVGSASYYGDYFTGSTSSVMWLDDFQLNY